MSLEETVCRNPATGEVLGYSALTNLEEAKLIIENAREAQKSWAQVPVRQRAQYIFKLRDYLTDRAEDIAEVISRNNGKTRIDALTTEVIPAAMAAGYYAKHAKQFLRTKRLRAGNILLINKRTKIVRVPFGVIGIIAPWNYTFGIPFSDVVMGLLAGNAVVLKCATATQMVGRTLEECFHAVGLPQGVFSYVNIPGREAGSAFLEGGIDKLFFTGSVETGQRLMAEAAASLTPLLLELGGNDAMLVCEDADLHRAVGGAAWAGMQNCGQTCNSVERIYVHEKVYESFLALLKQKVESLRVGYDEDFNVDLGAMTVERKVATVKRHVEDALAKGAVIYAQSSCPEGKGTFLPVMVLTEVNHDMLLMRDETFGPVLGVMRVRDMDEAVRLANDSYMGLTGSVWSRNTRYAERLARQIQAGVVMINDHTTSYGMSEAPFGGFKQSGIGRTHGAIGFEEMTQPQAIVHDILPFVKQNMWWYPHGRKIYKGMLGVIKLLYGRSIKIKLKGGWDLLKIFPRYFRVS